MKISTRARIKHLLWKYARPLFYVARGVRKRLHQRREQRIAEQMPPLIDVFRAAYGNVVQGGPCEGMKYTSKRLDSAYLPRLIGCFEEEIHGALDDVCRANPPLVLNVGCEQGYYAVGLARRLPAARVYAFDINADARQATAELARANDVADRVILEGECTHARLEELLQPGALVLCDIEGFEMDLLDPAKSPKLRQAHLVVELHDHERVGLPLTPMLLERFTDTHDITVFTKSERDPGRYSCLAVLPPDKGSLAVHEERMPGQQWAYLKARHS